MQILGCEIRLLYVVGAFHNRDPSNLDSSDQQIRLYCDLNLNLDYELLHSRFRLLGLPIILLKIMTATYGRKF